MPFPVDDRAPSTTPTVPFTSRHLAIPSITRYHQQEPISFLSFADDVTHSTRVFFLSHTFTRGILIHCNDTNLDAIFLLRNPIQPITVDYMPEDIIYFSEYPCCHPVAYFNLPNYRNMRRT